jgi:hypothetical protein
MYLDPTMLAVWRELATAVRTGETAFDKVCGTDFFDDLSANPDLSERFNSAMRQGTVLTAQQLPGVYDLRRFATIADLGGGGDATLIAAVLHAHPDLRGILFDTADGLAQADRTRRPRASPTAARPARVTSSPPRHTGGRGPLRAQECDPRLRRRPRRNHPRARSRRHPRPWAAADHRACARIALTERCGP